MPDPQDDRPIADASAFFDDRDHQGPDPEPSAGPEPDPGGYDLADHGPPPGPSPVEEAPASLPPEVPMPTEAPPSAPRPHPARKPKVELSPATVDQPWSRMAEWGPTLAPIGLALLATAALAYLSLSLGGWAASIATAFIGLGIAVLLAYPIAITLERPVRMTPEHAIRDYYAALSHHVPHYRRMWLLLSSAGRTGAGFGSFPAFREYWAGLVSGLKAGEVGRLTPLSVRIEDFKADKSAGLEAIEASYSIAVFLRGREADGPLHSARAETTLSRGPDRMWYLDDGRLPGR
ncbi:hypothetical protein [Tautonia plasticadhaerens]|uniref:Uncharacterized protein n=1 Tax=Tautonia plasticadhaerens TaxID=2527974 RepID=A0A518H784_9BACT|nr:hypothetical protein [Tautonia plasticadhaerens]QDV36705.1 hypothetical protein ElP_46340 [Tautonia plasticadhaerens]